MPTQDASPLPHSPIMVKGRPARWHDAPALLRAKAAQHGERIFTTIDGRPLSYAEMDRVSDLVAASLDALGVRAGDTVASMMFNCAEQVFGWFGTNRLGALWAPLNASLMGQDLAHTLKDAGARVLIVDADNAAKVARLPSSLREGLRVFVVGAGAGGKAVEDAGPGAQPFDALLELSGEALPRVELAPGGPAMILYSGGTTGLPKGIVLPHFAAICVGYRYGEVLAVSPSDHHYTTLPMFHASGIQFGILGPLLNDMTSTIDRRFSVSGFWDRVRAVGATIVDPIGTMMAAITREPPSPRDRDHKVRISTGVNGQVPPQVPAEFTRRFGIPIVDIYGNTECGAAMATSNQLHAQVPGSVGHPNGWSEIAILDENDSHLPPGTVGKIALRPTIPHSFMLRYHNNPEKTVETWRNLWVHTGDLGYLDERGYLFFVGREAHWLRRRGENISAHEVESILSDCPGVRECVVVGVPSELGEEDVKAWIIPDGARPAEKTIIEWCIARMAPFKVPRFVQFTDAFPRSATKQEIERAKLKALGNEGAWDREKHMGRLSAQAASSRRSAS